jgi:hypothetical protein
LELLSAFLFELQYVYVFFDVINFGPRSLSF